jgi:hypothetical protein
LNTVFRRLLSVATSIGLLATLIIGTHVSSRANDFSVECQGGFDPIIVGRVIDSSGNSIPNAEVQATFEINHGNWIERRSTNSSASVDGNYELCPVLTEEGLLAPTPAVGTEAIFSIRTWDDPSITVEKFDITNDDFQCFEMGGPCVFDLTLKQGSKLSFLVSESESTSGTIFDGQLYAAAMVVDEEEGDWLDVFNIGMFSSSTTGRFDIYGLTDGEFRFSLRPNESDSLMGSAWQVIANVAENPTVMRLADWGDREAVWSYETTGDPVEADSEIYELPSPVASTKFMLTDGILPLDNQHLAWPDDRTRVIPSGTEVERRFVNDPFCQTDDDGTYTSDQKRLCNGMIEINNRGEFLLPWESGFYQIGVHFGYNEQAVETYFVVEIEDSEIINTWRNSGYALNDYEEQVMTWEAIDFVNAGDVSNGLTLHAHDLKVKIADFEGGVDSYLNGYLCKFSDECSSDEMPAGQFQLYGGNVSEVGNIAFPDASMLGVTCDNSTDGNEPELQLFIDTGGWTPAKLVSTRFAIDCAGAFGARTFVGYNSSGGPIDLQNLALNTAKITGIALGPNEERTKVDNFDAYPIDEEGNRVDDNDVQGLRIENYYGSDSEHFGKFNINVFASGSYAITYGVNWCGTCELFGASGKIRIDVEVNEFGEVTSAFYGTELNQDPTITGTDALSDPIQAILKEANFKGTLVSQSGTPIRNQFLDFLIFDPDFDAENGSNDGYDYFDDANNNYTQGNGKFSVYLPSGQYRIALPARNGQPQTDIDIWVDTDDAACKFENQSIGDLCVVAETNWTLRYAEPNFTGTVLAGDSPVPSNINVLKRGTTSSWEYTRDYIDANNGEFAARFVTPGFYKLDIEPRTWIETPIEGFVKTSIYVGVDADKKICILESAFDFDSPVGDFDCPSGSTRELTESFSLDEANLSIKVLAPVSADGDPRPAVQSSVSVVDMTDELGLGEGYWSHTQTNSRGHAFLRLPETDELTRYFEVRIEPPWDESGLVLASKTREFCTKGDGSSDVYLVVDEECSSTPVPLVDGFYAVTLAEGNLTGRVYDPDGVGLPENSGVNTRARIWDNTCSSCGEGSTTWGWQWTNVSINNRSNGSFGGDLGPGVYLINASTWRSDYAPGSAVIRVGEISGSDEHPWCLVAADAEILDIPEYNNAESKLEDVLASDISGVSDCDPESDSSSKLDVLLREPNIIGNIKDPGNSPIQNSWGQILKIIGDNDWEREYLSGFNIQSGKFVGRIKLPTEADETAEYIIQFEQPHNQEGSRFSIALECTISGCESDGVDSAELELKYPAPNFEGRICSPDSTVEDTYLCDPVKYSHVNVQTWNADGDYWQWGNIWANTNNRGAFSLNLEDPGKYRITAYPSWNSPKGVQTHVEFEMVQGEEPVSLVAVFDPDIDGDPSTPDLEVQLLGPNVVGQLKFMNGSETKAMSYGGISASLRCDYNVDCPINSEDRWAWTSADKSGSYRLLLPMDGIWDVWVYSNGGQNPKPPIHMEAEISNGELVSWNYASTVTDLFNPSLGEVNFDALPSNLTITIEETLEKRIIKFKDENGNYIDQLTTYTSGGVTNSVNTRVPDGDYTIEVLKSSREGTMGSGEITVSGPDNLVTVSVSQ